MTSKPEPKMPRFKSNGLSLGNIPFLTGSINNKSSITLPQNISICSLNQNNAEKNDMIIMAKVLMLL
jgi:hypothetical protein